MSVNAVAAASSAQAQAQVNSAVAIKTLKMANDQQQSVISLLDAAVASAEAVQSYEPGKGAQVDVTA